MKQRILGCTGTKVSELCLGTMNFGWRVTDAQSLAILDAYHAAGGNFIQALAPNPAVDDGPMSVAASESVVGRWWRDRGHFRRELYLATRIAVRGPPAPGDARRAVELSRAIEDSLARLQTDHLDLLVCEWPNPERISSALRAVLDGVVRTGRVRHLAFAGLPVWRVVDEMHHGRRGNHARVDALQGDYSLLARTGFESEQAGVFESYRLGFIARSPLAGGLLAKREGGSHALATSRLRWLVERYGLDCGAKVVRALNQIAHEHSCTPAQVALAWVLHDRHVTSALIGVNSTAALAELTAAGDLPLSVVDLERLGRASTVQRLHLPLRPTPASTVQEEAVSDIPQPGLLPV